MTEREAFAVIAVILAGYPREPAWSDATVSLWVAELADVGAGEGMAAARQMIRSSEFPSVRAFHAALGTVREQQADLRRSLAFDRPALPPGPDERRATPETAARARAEIDALAARWRTKSARALAEERRRRRRPRSVRESDFYPPDPKAAPEGGFT